MFAGTPDPIDRLPAIAELLTGRYRDRLSPSDLHLLELRLDHHDWIHQDIADVRAMLPLHLRELLS
jgi:hypothetical protein